MPIDVDAPFSHGWWFKRLAAQQADRLPHLEKMHKRYIGEAPPPQGPSAAQVAYKEFQRLARTSYEDTITRAVLDRQDPTGFRTAAENDDAGDSKAAEVWAANEMAAQVSDILEDKLSMGYGYAMIGPPDDESDELAIITAEDPRQCITAHDPVRKSRVRAGLKMFYDPDAGVEVAYVMVRGGVKREDGTLAPTAVVRRAERKARQTSLTTGFRLSAQSWNWVPEDGWSDNALELRTVRVPMVRFQNRGGLTEFEKHLDLIDRIRHTILQRMVIVTMQAFRQRAVSGLPDRYPDDYPDEALRGQPIDYSQVFTADPAAVWLLPPTLSGQAVQMWESGELRLEGVLGAVKDDIREMASVTRTPFYEFIPDGANQTAEGASTQKEGITFKVGDHNTRDGITLANMMSIAFDLMGDTQRAKVGQLETMWGPIQKHSLTEMADAAVKAKGIRPTLAILTDIYQLPPAQATRELEMLREEQADALLLAAPTGQQPGQQGQGPVKVESERTDQQPAVGAGATGDLAQQ